MSSEDLLDHFKLEAVVSPEHTIHPSYQSGRTRGSRERVEIKWNRREIIGEGSFGQVWRETKHDSHGARDTRAVKVVQKRQMTLWQIDFKKELLALAKLSKPDYQQAEVLVSFLGWFETDEAIYFAMEYFKNGDLAQHIESISTEDEVRQITLDVLEGLKIMHAEGFAHRDLKPQNIFVVEKPPQSRGWFVKIGDFGNTKRTKNQNTALRTQAGTPHFQAPEIQGFIDNDDETSEYDNTVDIWSLGCVVYNLSSHKVPFLTSHDVNKYCQRKLSLPREPLTLRLGTAGIEFIESLLVPEPARRMTIEQSLGHPWISDALSWIEHKPIPVVSKGKRAAQVENLGTSHFPGINRPQGPHAISDPTDAHRSQTLPKIIDNLTIDHDRTVVPRAMPDASSQRATADALTIQPARREDPFSRALNNTYMQRQGQYRSYRTSDQSDEHTRTANTPFDVDTNSAGSEVHADIHVKRKIKISGHSGSVTCVAFAPNNTVLASCSEDKTARLWNMTTGQLRYTLRHSDWVWKVAFSPDSKLLVSSSMDGTVKLWDVTTGQLRRTLSHFGGFDGVALSPDGKLLVYQPDKNTVGLWDITRDQLHLPLSQSVQVNSVAFSPDTKLLASGSADKTMKLWDTTTGQLRRTLSGHTDSVETVAFSPDRRLIASGSMDKTARLWDVITGQLRYILHHSDRVLKVAFSPDGKLLVSRPLFEKVRIWDTATGGLRYIFSERHGRAESVAFSPDGRLLVSGSVDKTVNLWDTATGQLRHTLSGHSDSVYSVAFSSDGRLLASGSFDSNVMLWEDENASQWSTAKQAGSGYKIGKFLNWVFT